MNRDSPLSTSPVFPVIVTVRRASSRTLLLIFPEKAIPEAGRILKNAG